MLIKQNNSKQLKKIKNNVNNKNNSENNGKNNTGKHKIIIIKIMVIKKTYNK